MVHGWTGLLDGRIAGDWQNLLAGELAHQGAGVDLPRFSDPDAPRLDVWLAELREHLDAAPTGVERVVMAHSLGALLWLHHAAGEFDPRLKVDRVLLASPPAPRWRDEEVASFQPTPLDAAGVRRAASVTRMVVGDDDRYGTVADATNTARRLDVELDVIPGGGHLDPKAGYGRWPSARDWVLDPTVRLGPRVPRPAPVSPAFTQHERGTRGV
ncbi:hypothetical protein EV193_11444 [Herbihabitans rhizosphaerae]|uniref:Hydrolase n=2 Tax=Herbihabitans rhizosphaerae TaxID=1872711 RepID=A0A4V2ERH7_9PSEU|nr:hypothetical protein EV193_11444 [Herbihabitans rhizosphaerae]